MKIIQILGHNAVAAQGMDGELIVLVGKGVGFHKKKGDRVNGQLVSQVFVEKKQTES